MKPYCADRLLKTAQEQTGLSDFGPDDFMEGFTRFIASINVQGEISEAHSQNFEERMLRLLMNRLWFAKDLADHPEISDEDISAPVIIVSLPRTGSTKLHRMLSASGDFQALLMWRAHMFARIPGLDDGGKARRVRETRDYEKWMYEVSPESITGHPMFTEEAEEDQLLSEFTFRDFYCSNVFNVPDYAQWLVQADQEPRFSYFRKQIQYLQWQQKPKRSSPWLLKSPLHLGGESDLTRIFKNPRFIVTHRDPVKCMPSIANPVRYMRKMYSDHDTASELGPSLTGIFSHKTLEHMKWRDSHSEFGVLDLSMREITEDAIGTAQKIYDFLGMTLSSIAKAEIQNWEQRNPIEKHGKNVYTAEGFGTTDDDIRRAFRPYIERFSEFL
jgi:hypothetical protein